MNLDIGADIEPGMLFVSSVGRVVLVLRAGRRYACATPSVFDQFDCVMHVPSGPGCPGQFEWITVDRLKLSTCARLG